MHDEWLTSRIAYLRGLKSPNDQQRLLLLLAEKPERTSDDNRKLSALLKAEKAAERAQKARANAARIVNAEKAAERKARDRELYQSAGLLILAGLVDSGTGSPTLDRGELLGALLGLSKVATDDPRRADWKRAGDTLLAERARK
ncbi:Conjugal transfer protein TraD [Azotobacter beijerinckii]|uniref:Conjugal transfer protein TraD n=1 Tax=Azotobacter beijerinckii TaxID=170623 RepID=A0A1H9QQT7_9GAMM|nr:conjugal transfer protein TraD [Azotobacter beijerinckii]SER62199.1 Conjugal transfer protein TraD [Azotobacter beijerinckii]